MWQLLTIALANCEPVEIAITAPFKSTYDNGVWKRRGDEKLRAPWLDFRENNIVVFEQNGKHFKSIKNKAQDAKQIFLNTDNNRIEFVLASDDDCQYSVVINRQVSDTACPLNVLKENESFIKLGNISRYPETAYDNDVLQLKATCTRIQPFTAAVAFFSLTYTDPKYVTIPSTTAATTTAATTTVASTTVASTTVASTTTAVSPDTTLIVGLAVGGVLSVAALVGIFR